MSGPSTNCFPVGRWAAVRDNEPLVHRCRLIAEVAAEVIDEAVEPVESVPAEHWGSLRRA